MRQPSAGVAHVLSVQDSGDGIHARWNFDTDVAGVTDGNGLWANTNPPDGAVTITGARQVTATYSSGFEVGQDYVTIGTSPGVTFVGGAPLPPGQSGTIT